MRAYAAPFAVLRRGAVLVVGLLLPLELRPRTVGQPCTLTAGRHRAAPTPRSANASRTPPSPTHPSLAVLAAAGILALVILAPVLFSFGGSNASGLSPQVADAPTGLVPLAFQAGAMTGIDGNVLLAVAKVETD
jgi:hypothetical protein